MLVISTLLIRILTFKEELAMSNQNLKEKIKNKHINTRLLQLSLLPIVAIALIICILIIWRVNSLVETTTEDQLKSLAVSVRNTYNKLNNDPYMNKGTKENPKIYKGGYNISEHNEIVDTLMEEGDAVATIFWDNTRVMTSIKDSTGKRAVGTTLDDDEILKSVLEDGKGYFKGNLEIQGSKYHTYYLPLYQQGSSSEIVGMIFVGQQSEEINSLIRNLVIFIVAIIGAMLVITAILVILMAKNISTALKHGVSVVNEIAGGNLTIPIDANIAKRRDEIGVILYAIGSLRESLVSIVSNIRKSSTILNEASAQLETISSETARAVEQVEKAIEDIAEGASSQAEETQKASEDVIVMGDLITQTSDDVKVLDENAHMMKRSSDEASATLLELKATNEESSRAIDIIYGQTNTTNESAMKIQEATHLITSIAEETSLLSLNASIEAARAGEQGRGFAVVAAQIQNLADQSNESAARIEEIIASLISDSEKAVQTMDEVKVIIGTQNTNMDKTERIFETVKAGIDRTFVQAEDITDKTKQLDQSRVSIVDIVQNLTAVAEENAASTQETSAASAEVAATVANASDSAKELKRIANELEENMSIFRL